MKRRKAVDELRDTLGVDANACSRQRIDLLHMDCEGCEWEALTRLVETDVLQYIGVLHVSFQNYGVAGIGDLLPKYCLIRKANWKKRTKTWKRAMDSQEPRDKVRVKVLLPKLGLKRKRPFVIYL